LESSISDIDKKIDQFDRRLCGRGVLQKVEKKEKNIVKVEINKKPVPNQEHTLNTLLYVYSSNPNNFLKKIELKGVPDLFTLITQIFIEIDHNQGIDFSNN
jgi:hypothetical protein